MGNAKSFKDLLVWQKAHELVIEIYETTNKFPLEERFCLLSQMRRAAVYIPANISEGFVKRSIKDKSNFNNIARGSLEELKYYLILSEDLGYSKNETLLLKADEVGKLPHRLLSSLP